MHGKKKFERILRCDKWSDATISIHITDIERRKIDGIEGRIYYLNPNRIGIDFDNFRNGTHDFIPNLSPADVVQFINRLDILSHDFVREALRKGVLPHKFGLELESRRKLDFDIGYCSSSGNEELRMYYEDPLRDIERFEIGRIDISLLPRLIKALKEVFVEYYHLMNKSLLLKEANLM